MKAWMAAILLATHVAGAPLSAQDDNPIGVRDDAAAIEQVTSAMQNMFPVEPLTAQQQARLPQTRRIVGMIVPEGTLGELMGSMFDTFLGPLEQSANTPTTQMMQRLGPFDGATELGEAEAREIMAILDPAYQQRSAIMAEQMPLMMRGMMDALEPAMRKAMADAYAIHFDGTELDDIEAFFSTPSGANYARKSFTMSSDPRIVGASMEAMPQIMEQVMAMTARMEAATADLPPEKAWADLTTGERARLRRISGLSDVELSDALAPVESADGE
ncbi:MAG: DUF2059 domain-containing protein [Parerythrobacter sp.]